MSSEQNPDRSKHEKENIIAEVGVKKSRQLFNERDLRPENSLAICQAIKAYLHYELLLRKLHCHWPGCNVASN